MCAAGARKGGDDVKKYNKPVLRKVKIMTAIRGG
jgi:hypothetical protein